MNGLNTIRMMPARDRVAAALAECAYAGHLTVLERDAGLHFLVQVDTELTDEELTARFVRAGIRVRALSAYYERPFDSHCLVINYSGLDEKELYRFRNVEL